MKGTSDEKVALRGVILISACEILALLFFVVINGGF